MNRVRKGARVLRPALAVLAVAFTAAAATLTVAAWRCSDMILVPGGAGSPREIRVLGAAPGRIRLARTRDSLRPGTWALQWEGGYGSIGPILATDGHAVVREFHPARGAPPAGCRAALRGVSRSADPRSMLGLAYADVTFEGPLGRYPAWLVPGRDSTWVLYVHGRGTTRAEGLRTLDVMAARGLPGMLVTYRNDAGAPASADGFSHLGLTEWSDLEAAARYALGHGARDLVLSGYSMGGQIVMQFLARSSLAPRVRGVVLESPVLDWRATLRLRAQILGVPPFVAELGCQMTALRAGIDWGELDWTVRAREVRAPILLFHCLHDSFAPESVSEAIARALPLQITLIPVEAGDHVEAWNVDPARYAAALVRWLDAYGIGPPARTANAQRPGPATRELEEVS